MISLTQQNLRVFGTSLVLIGSMGCGRGNGPVVTPRERRIEAQIRPLRVSHGPFGIMRHPIYAGLIIIAVGQGLLTGFDWRAFLLIVASGTYAAGQGRAEARDWKRRLKHL